jgi:hypothetical protein
LSFTFYFISCNLSMRGEPLAKDVDVGIVFAWP